MSTTELEQTSLPSNAYEPLELGQAYDPLIPAQKRIPELTSRSIGWGVFLCVIFTIASAYSGLKVGQVMEAAIPISILAIGLARVYPRRSTVLENVIITGIGGVAGSVVGGAIFTLPALYILKLDPHPMQTIFICLAGGCLGVLFLIPLRRYFVRDMHGLLPYPEASAVYPATIPISSMSAVQIYRSYVRFIGVGAIATAGIFGIVKSLRIVAGSFGIALRVFHKSEVVAPERTDRDTSMIAIFLGVTLSAVGVGVYLAQLPVGWRIVAIGTVMILVFSFFFTSVAANPIATTARNPVQ